MRRVLIVEDEPEALEMLLAWMKHQRGCEIRSAVSGRAAVEISDSFKPDVLITDYLLEDDLTGVDVIEHVQAGGKKVRCVLVTGMLRNALLEGLHRIHGVPILTKPVNFRRLGELISPAAD
jgi:two-component system OmpR family response regulator